MYSFDDYRSVLDGVIVNVSRNQVPRNALIDTVDVSRIIFLNQGQVSNTSIAIKHGEKSWIK